MSKNVFFILFLISFNFSGRSQSILWEQTYNSTNNSSPILRNIKYLKGDKLLAIGISQSLPSKAELLHLDTAGQLLNNNQILQDIYPFGVYTYGLIDVPHEVDKFYLYGTGYDSMNIQRDFVAKIDTIGNWVWYYQSTYFVTYISSKTCLALPDKSTISSGYILQPTNDWDIVIRRVDSLGTLIWEKTLVLLGDQDPLDILDVFDGSVLISGMNSTNNILLRIEYDGNFLDTINIPTSNGIPQFQKLRILYDKNIGLGVLSRVGFSTNFGTFYELNPNLNVVRTESMEQGVYYTPITLMDSSLLFNQLATNFDFKLTNRDWKTNFSNWQLPYGNANTNFKFAGDFQLSDGDAYIGGYDDSSLNQEYYIAKIKNVGQEWIPDPCQLSPLNSGFSWSYDAGVLIFEDTSFSGLQYHDSIYHYSWSSSNGFFSDSSTLVALWDTAVEPSIDIDLIIENFYRCKDTVEVTLSKSLVGIEEQLSGPFGLEVFPNPVEDVLTVEIRSRMKSGFRGEFKLISVQGQEVLSGSIVKETEQLDLSSISPGVYFLKLSLENQEVFRKVIKR